MTHFFLLWPIGSIVLEKVIGNLDLQEPVTKTKALILIHVPDFQPWTNKWLLCLIADIDMCRHSAESIAKWKVAMAGVTRAHQGSPGVGRGRQGTAGSSNTACSFNFIWTCWSNWPQAETWVCYVSKCCSVWMHFQRGGAMKLTPPPPHTHTPAFMHSVPMK